MIHFPQAFYVNVIVYCVFTHYPYLKPWLLISLQPILNDKNLTNRFQVKIGTSPVRYEPVDGRKMLALCEFFVETPKHLDNAKSCRGNRIGEVTSGWGDRTHDANRALSLWASNALDAASSFVERSKTCTQIRWITTRQDKYFNY